MRAYTAITSFSEIAVVTKNLVIIGKVILNNPAVELRTVCIKPFLPFRMAVIINVVDSKETHVFLTATGAH